MKLRRPQVKYVVAACAVIALDLGAFLGTFLGLTRGLEDHLVLVRLIALACGLASGALCVAAAGAWLGPRADHVSAAGVVLFWLPVVAAVWLGEGLLHLLGATLAPWAVWVVNLLITAAFWGAATAAIWAEEPDA